MNLCDALNNTSDDEFAKLLANTPPHLQPPLQNTRDACRLVDKLEGEQDTISFVLPQQINEAFRAAKVVETVKHWKDGQLVEEVERTIEEKS